MRVIFYELKKIWNIKILLAIAVVCAMFYIVFLGFDIKHYPNGHPHIEDVEFCTMLTQKYGTTLEQNEFEEFMTIRSGLVVQIDELIANDTYCQTAKIRNFDDLVLLQNTLDRDWTDEETQATDSIYNNPQNGYVLYKINMLDRIQEFYTSDITSRTDIVHARLNEIENSNESLGIISEQTIFSTKNYIANFAWLVILATIALVSPLLTSDRLRKLQLLQYSSKMGRRIIWKQLTATLLSSFCLTTVLVLVFGAIYATNGTQIFWNNYISSFNSGFISSIRLTFGQYVMILVGMVYLLGLAISLVAFTLSRFCSNFIALIAGAIPVTVGSIMLCAYLVFETPLSIEGKFGIALFEPLICTAFLILAALVAVSVAWREKKIEIA